MPRNERAIGRFFDEVDSMPLDLARPAGAQIFETLKAAILSMDIAPGSLIPEVDIGKRFSASRTPVREALMRLREAGLVVTSSGRGNFATKLSEPRLREAQFIRLVLETGNVESLCEVGLDDHYRGELQENLNNQKRCISKERKLQFQALDDRFHITLAMATGFPRMADILEREKMVLDRLRVLSLDQTSHIQTLFDEHAAIYEAIVSRDGARARKVMTEHLTSVLKMLSALASRHREYFE